MKTTSSEKAQSTPIGIFLRLTRAQFLPLVMIPALVGASLSYYDTHEINFLFLVLTIAGVSLLHLGANAIDDSYDYQNGVDQIANSIFPPDFGGWKPLPRGLITLKGAKLVSYFLLFASLLFGAYLGFEVGVWAFFLGLTGVVLAWIYTAPPFKLDYRGLALGEVSIFFSFGPIAVVGAYYVQTAILSVNALLVSIPLGLMTVTILLYHDLIFVEVYSKAQKLSYAAKFGRKIALYTSLVLTALSYAFIIGLVLVRTLPLLSLAAPIVSILILLRKAGTFRKPNEPPPNYVPFTANGLLSNWLFGLVLAISLVI
jgi:1,4-dihydroxy-2-naphthoate octaprenyltransferase